MHATPLIPQRLRVARRAVPWLAALWLAVQQLALVHAVSHALPASVALAIASAAGSSAATTADAPTPFEHARDSAECRLWHALGLAPAAAGAPPAIAVFALPMQVAAFDAAAAPTAAPRAARARGPPDRA